MNNESPEQKAKRLGVPLIPKPPMRIPEPSKYDEHQDLYKQKYLSEVQSVCGSCGKEITRADKKYPCGRQDCPFGVFKN